MTAARAAVRRRRPAYDPPRAGAPRRERAATAPRNSGASFAARPSWGDGDQNPHSTRPAAGVKPPRENIFARPRADDRARCTPRARQASSLAAAGCADARRGERPRRAERGRGRAGCSAGRPGRSPWPVSLAVSQRDSLAASGTRTPTPPRRPRTRLDAAARIADHAGAPAARRSSAAARPPSRAHRARADRAGTASSRAPATAHPARGHRRPTGTPRPRLPRAAERRRPPPARGRRTARPPNAFPPAHRPSSCDQEKPMAIDPKPATRCARARRAPALLGVVAARAAPLPDAAEAALRSAAGGGVRRRAGLSASSTSSIGWPTTRSRSARRSRCSA